MRLLVDSSSWIWAERNPADPAAAVLRAVLDDGRAALCAPVRLELLRGAPSLAAFDRLADQFDALPDAPVDARVCELAIDIQRALAARPGSKHRAVPIADLLTAAAGIESERAIIHRDRDFETIAEVTRQPVRWLGPA